MSLDPTSSDLALAPVATLNGNALTSIEIEAIERSTVRYVTQALWNHRSTIVHEFQNIDDKPEDIAEDLTREAIDRLGTSRLAVRLLSKCDYKQARLIFLPDSTVPQALFLDSKAEKDHATVSINMTQISLDVRHRRAGSEVNEPGLLATLASADNGYQLLTSSVFAKYVYRAARPEEGVQRVLEELAVVSVPNGLLQWYYNPDVDRTIWRAGRNAPSLGEAFRVRLVEDWLSDYDGLEGLPYGASWRVTRIPLTPEADARLAERKVKKPRYADLSDVIDLNAPLMKRMSPDDLIDFLKDHYSDKEIEQILNGVL